MLEQRHTLMKELRAPFQAVVTLSTQLHLSPSASLDQKPSMRFIWLRLIVPKKVQSSGKTYSRADEK